MMRLVHFKSFQKPIVLGLSATTVLASLWLVRRFALFVRGRRPLFGVARAHIELRVTSGSAKGTVYQLRQSDSITVGRRACNTIVLPDTGVSGSHFEISYNESEMLWQLMDMGSLNGTLLNGVHIALPNSVKGSPHSLSTGDCITIGERTVVEVVCSPSVQRPVRSVTPTTADVIAQELLRRVCSSNHEKTRHDVALQTFSLEPLPALGCRVQRQGTRTRGKCCEDTFAHVQPIAVVPMHALCLCDGHCGDSAATQVQALVPEVLVSQLKGSVKEHVAQWDLNSVLKDTFLLVEEKVKGEDGCTMSLVLLYSDGEGGVKIQSANVGDSAVVCADFSKMLKMHLTENHRVTHALEQQRLQETGSLLTHNGTRLMGLNLSRSIGDRALKRLNPGFVAEPYVSKVHDVPQDDSLLLIMASDGLWDVTNANIVMRIAYRVLAEHPHDVTLVSRVLMEHAIRQQSKDDITIAVVLIDQALSSQNAPM